MTWHNSDDFWKTAQTWLFPPTKIEIAKEEVQNIIKLLEITPGSRILDMCCGIGRHSIEFARLGYSVVGVDRTERYLEQAKSSAEAAGVNVDFLHGDMQKFKADHPFDIALSIFTSFGYFEKHEDNLKVLENLSESLKSGGKLVIEIMGKEVLARIYKKRDWDEHGGMLLAQERKPIDSWSRMENRYVAIDSEGQKEFKITHWIYSAWELEQMLRSVSFSSAESYGSLSGDPYDHEAARLIVVGTK